MKLYSGPLSLFTVKIRVALAEKGLAYELVPVPFSREKRYQPKHPDVVRINPKSQVPCLEDGAGEDAVELYDSTVIFEYLEDRYPSPALYPTNVAAKARCRLLELEADEVFFPGIWGLITERFYPQGAKGRDPQAEQESVKQIAWFYERLAAVLGDRDYLVGEFSAADISHFIFAHAAATLGEPVPAQHSNLVAWFDRVSTRPAVVAELESLSDWTVKLLAA
jgi:glutathione S-transferase